MTTDPVTLEVVVSGQSLSAGGEKRLWGREGQTIVAQKLEDVRTALRAEVEKLQSVFGALGGAPVSGYRCTEVELQMEFKAEGGFRLVGNAQASTGATLTLRFALIADDQRDATRA